MKGVALRVYAWGSVVGHGRGVVEGAFALLEELAGGDEQGLTKLAASAGLPKATAHRLLDQLVAVGAVMRRDGRYRVGPQMFRLGQAWQPAPMLREAARHPLRQLAALTRASVSVAVPNPAGAMIVGGMLGEVDEVFPLRPGVVLPSGSAAEAVVATSTGAARPEDYSVSEWARLVADVGKHGVAVVHEVHGVPVSCAAAPVRTASGTVVGAVGVAVLDGRRLAPMTEAVRRAANMVSANLARP